MWRSPSVAMAMTRPERAVTSWMLERVFSYLRTEEGSSGSLVAMTTTGGLVDEGAVDVVGGAEDGG